MSAGRGSRSMLFCEKGFLKNVRLQPVTLFKKKLQHRCFPLDLAKL